MVVKNHDLVEVEAKLLHQTPDAFLIDDGDRHVWCPKSFTEQNSDGTFTMPEWFALEKELI